MKKSELRKIIKEEIQSLFKNNGRLTPYLSEEDFVNKWKTTEFKKPINEMGNPLPPKDSNWYEFAEKFDVGILDLDKLAYLLKLKDFRNMDISISPKNLYGRDPKKFTKAIQQSSLNAEDMTPSQIQKVIKSLWP
jgi:hypothetical protein